MDKHIRYIHNPIYYIYFHMNIYINDINITNICGSATSARRMHHLIPYNSIVWRNIFTLEYIINLSIYINGRVSNKDVYEAR